MDADNSRSRAWVLTLFAKNLENLKIDKDLYGNPENYDKLANYLVLLWQKQHKDRKAAVAICVSADGVFHVHMVVYSPNPVKFDVVRQTFGNAHTEPQKGTKKQALEYIRKVGKYAEKDEKVLHFLDFPEAEKSSRTDYLDEARRLLDEGYTPEQIFEQDIHFRKYEAIVNKEYVAMRVKKMPVIRDLRVFWHVGTSGSGKTLVYAQLLKQHGDNSVYFYNDFSNGGLDKYVEYGCPDILFMDELKPNNLTYGNLLNLLDVYKNIQTHSRYMNIVNLWTQVHITSVFSPENLYKEMVSLNSTTDSYKQLERRITAVVYHYKKGDECRQFILPMYAYKGIDDMREQAMSNDLDYENAKVHNDILMAALTSTDSDVLKMFN